MDDPRRKKLLYRAMHRGFKEADIMLGKFAEQNLAAMTETEIEEFERLLEVPDRELYAWIIGQSPAPANYEGPMLDRLRAFPVSKHIS